MGNNCTAEPALGQTYEHNLMSRQNTASGTGLGCVGCFPNPHGTGYNVDYAELQTHNHEMVPMGKISMGSIAFLQKEEISFLKACAGRNVSALRYFTKKGVNVNLLDEDRTSPLHVACRSGSLQVVEELINSGATVNMADMAGWTSLHVAAFHQRPLICHLLLKKGADPYLMTRQGETSWDMVREKATEEIFFIHFDRTELRRMSNMKREDPCADLHDEYLSLSEYRPKEITCRTRHEIEIRDMNTPKGGHRFNKSAKDNDEIKSPSDNLKNLVEVNVTQNTFLSRHNRFISTTEEPYSGHKTHSEARGLSASAGPKKHKYYVYFKKMKAQHLSNFRENKDVLNTLNSDSSYEEEGAGGEHSGVQEWAPTPFTRKSSIRDNLAHDDLYASKNNSYMTDHQLPTLTMKNRESILESLKHLSPGPKVSKMLVPGNINKSQGQLQHYFLNKSSVNNSIIQMPSVSKMDRSNMSMMLLMNQTHSVHRLFMKDPREINFTNLENETVPVSVDLSHMLDLADFKVDQKYCDLVYNMGIELFNYDGILGISFLMLFKFIRPNLKDVALFLYSEETQGSIKKSLQERTNFLGNLQLKECYEILQQYSSFFHFEDLRFIESLQTYLSSFVIENDPEKIDWILRGFAKQYYRMIRRKLKTQQVLPDNQKFDTVEAIRMLAFTTVMLDIELHHSDKKPEDEDLDLDQIRKELHSNLAGINDGENFSQYFINNIFEEIQREKLIKYVGHAGANHRPKFSFKTVKFLVRSQRQSKKKKENIKEYLMYFAGPICFMVKFLGEKSFPKGLFMLNNVKIEQAGNNSKSIKFAANKTKTFSFIKFKNNGPSLVSQKSEISLNLMNDNDFSRIKDYMTSI